MGWEGEDYGDEERENQIKIHQRKDAFDKGESLSTSEFNKSHLRRFSWRHYTGQMLGFCNINLNACFLVAFFHTLTSRIDEMATRTKKM